MCDEVIKDIEMLFAANPTIDPFTMLQIIQTRHGKQKVSEIYYQFQARRPKILDGKRRALKAIAEALGVEINFPDRA